MPLKIRVQNFQSIKDQTLEIDGFCAITGQNNVGKSAFIRAVYGLLTNTGGTWFVRNGEKMASVELTFDDGTVVLWEKGKGGINQYTINGKFFENVGHKPPHVLAEKLGIFPLEISGRPFWPQIATPTTGKTFLLDQTGSVLAEAIADVERVGKLNRALKEAESERRSINAQLKVRHKDVEKLTKELETFSDLGDLDTLVTDASAYREKLILVRRSYEMFCSLRSERNESRSTVESLRGVENLQVPARDEIDRLNRLKRKIEILQDYKTRMGEVRTRLKAFESFENALAKIEATKEAFQEKQRRVDKIKKAISDFHRLRGERSRLSGKISTYESRIENKNEELSELKNQISNFLGGLGECPTCNARIEVE